jgi:hypothetical protein
MSSFIVFDDFGLSFKAEAGCSNQQFIWGHTCKAEFPFVHWW